ncbi:MAG: NAD-dependent epimerase/dehydratase family protein [Candidatus Aminicenantes bacterium]|nr:NAD-dependent epimerase/dehydratase family protein [Candidatus Aminicenantes bacterium]
MKVLVTGGAGFIGSHVVDSLIKEGHDVIVVDDLSMGRRQNINPRAKFYQMDICHEGLTELFQQERPDVVNHHAAQVNLRLSVEDPLSDARVNLLGSLNLLESSRRTGVKKFIYISSGGAIYGEPKKLPVSEDDPICPLSPYGLHKYMVELYLPLYYQSYGLRYTILRYPNVYGPRQDPKGEAGVVAIFSQQMLRGQQPVIFGDGSKTRDYVFVEDIVHANMLVMDGGDQQAFNLGWGREVTDQEIFDGVREALASDIQPIYGEKRPGEIEHIYLDSSKIKTSLGWTPRIPLEEGIPMAVEYYQREEAERS